MISRLTLTDFRNHTFGRINTGGHRNIIITGPNGAGKTAVLEAVSVLGGERGMRGVPMTDIARFNGSGGFAVHADLNDGTEISVSFNAGDSNRKALIDGDAARLPDLGKILRIVWITPKEDRIFIDAAADRRAFFDRLAAAFDPTHSGRVARFSKLMSERAAALKNGADGRWLDAIDVQVAATAVAIAAARIQYAGEVNYFLKTSAISVTGTLESMVISDAPTAESQYLKYLYENRTLIGDKMQVDGPHKSDFGLFNNVLNLPAHLTSTGQQKSALLDLILAHAKLVHTKTARHPIILLDEAAAHLDTAARQHLFAELGAADAQVWATGLERAAFDNVPDATFVACTNGEINNIL